MARRQIAVTFPPFAPRFVTISPFGNHRGVLDPLMVSIGISDVQFSRRADR
jgi:hypothetical protein